METKLSAALLERQTIGIDRIRMELRGQFFDLLLDNHNIPTSDQECEDLQDITRQASIGQLYQLANMRNDKLKTVKLLSVDTDGIIYLTFCGMYGAMELTGTINT